MSGVVGHRASFARKKPDSLECRTGTAQVACGGGWGGVTEKQGTRCEVMNIWFTQ